jgi:hypothetical protein
MYAVTPWRAHRQVKKNEIKFKKNVLLLLAYYQSYDKLKPHDGCKKLPGFVIALVL